MTRDRAISTALRYFDSGEFQQLLARRVALRTESQRPDRAPQLAHYLREEIGPQLSALGFELHFIANPLADKPPFLVAIRMEAATLPTLLSYGHGDVVFGDDENWRADLDPWQLTAEGDRWYARGSADNKGQHCINLAALEQVWHARGGRLGFNCKLLFEMGEEISSPGLAELCREHAALLKADLFIASDGPRVSAPRPTLFLGSRGAVNFRLTINARDNACHSGNWGGLLSNPGTRLAHAIAALISARGELQVAALKPDSLTPAVRAILSSIRVGGMPGDPALACNWGEPGLTPAERLYGWNTLEVLTFITGNPARPMNAIPASATAVCQLRFVVGTDWQRLGEHVTAHLAAAGFTDVEVEVLHGSPATRFDPTDPLVEWIMHTMTALCEQPPALLPNLGGSLPNDVFADILGLPTLWVPHSYPACGQHGVNEHLLTPVAREGLQIMTALLWDLGERGDALIAQHRARAGGAQ
ncbi:M20 family metallopeptidase [Pantoea eucrina]|uniref:M20 family metallopeptidase n=1 Tax=Pantoea eucrina TaxID=472693 RepID=UPI0024B77EFD|nr:M20 family metallopeptidase [Pantoea eucrina]MDJ0024648.1 M20 family metallopeptidase [Pantoea eucrina]